MRKSTFTKEYILEELKKLRDQGVKVSVTAKKPDTFRTTHDHVIRRPSHIRIYIWADHSLEDMAEMIRDAKVKLEEVKKLGETDINFIIDGLQHKN